MKFSLCVEVAAVVANKVRCELKTSHSKIFAVFVEVAALFEVEFFAAVVVT